MENRRSQTGSFSPPDFRASPADHQQEWWRTENDTNDIEPGSSLRCTIQPRRQHTLAEQNAETGWVRDARAGDRVAFSCLVEAYWDRIRSWLFTLVHQAQVAEDLTQEVFLKVWLALPTLEEDGSFRAWLFRIAHNLALDEKKRPRHLHEEDGGDSLVSQDPGPLTVLLDREMAEALREACQRLPETYREAYLLWSSERMSFNDLAQVLDITEVNARWRVCMARRFLVAELQPLLEVSKR
jgi:RNA polymerase sigma-70 factor, ECF subfamily